MASSIRRLLLPPSSDHPIRVVRIDDCFLSICKDGKSSKKMIKHNWEVALIVIGCALFSSLLILMIVKYYIWRQNSNNNASRTRNLNHNPPILFNTQEDFIDEEQGPQLDHPIWYIRTVGLDRSVVESITVFKYKAGEGLIEGTECSVCLGEFEDDESLRLLPKCSHAFHVQCIGTWLQSHKNCPLCRAPIVRASDTEQAMLEVPMAVGPSLNEPEEAELENLHDRGTSATDIDSSVTRIGDVAGEDGIRDSNLGSSRIKDAGKIWALLDRVKSLRVASDLGDRSRIMGKDIEKGRRSCSMDSPAATEIYHAIGIATCDRARASSKRQALEMLNSSLSIK